MSAQPMNRKKAIVLRARLAFLGACLVSVTIVGRLFILQFVQGDRWRAESKKKNVQERFIKPTRGNIYSDNGSLLATTLPQYRLAMNPDISNIPDSDFVGKLDSLTILLAHQFKDKPPAEYREMIREARRQHRKFLYLNKQYVDFATRKRMLKWPLFRRTLHTAGPIFEKIEKRYVPFGVLAGRSIGYSNGLTHKSVGLEASYDTLLAGTAGRGIFRRIAGQHWKPLVEISRPHSGFDIQTTIDINIQDVAETALHNALQKHHANFGCVVLMKVETGEIKAIANLGLNEKDNTYSEDYNYAVARKTEPGSTFKLASFMAMLEEGKIKVTDTVQTGNGEWEIMGKRLRDSHEGGWGNITAERVFSASSNIGTAKLMMKTFGQNPQKYIDYLQKFGLNTPLNFQLQGGANPWIKKPGSRDWYGTTMPWMSVGYEVEMSPLQILTFYNGVANGGTVVQPYIVSEIRDGEHVVERHKTKVIAESIASEATLQTVRDLLIEVVESGTASNIKNTEYRIAGKTGTSQKLKNGVYTHKYYTSFCGFFPADKPKYSCIVVIDEPKGVMQYGADVAAPVFKEVSEKVNSLEIDMHKPLPKSDEPKFAADVPKVGGGRKDEMSRLCNRFGISNYNKDSVGEWVMAKNVDKAVVWKPMPDRGDRLPDVRGMTLRDALFLIENKGYKVRHFGEGRVAQMSPSPGKVLNRGATISLLMR